MDTIQQLISTSELKTSYLETLINKRPPLFLHYDKESDILLLLLVSPEIETIVHYIDRHVAVLYTTDELEIVGLQIEDFESEFVPMYGSLKKAWSIRNTEIKTGNVWDFSLAVQEKKIKVAVEVTKAVQPIIGLPALEIEKALEFTC